MAITARLRNIFPFVIVQISMVGQVTKGWNKGAPNKAGYKAELSRAIGREQKWPNVITSKTRSIYDQQYPRPAFLFSSSDFPIVSGAAAPEGQCPVEYRPTDESDYRVACTRPKTNLPFFYSVHSFAPFFRIPSSNYQDRFGNDF